VSKFITLLFALLISFSLFADTYVKGYYRKNGTYVQPHYRSTANGTKSDNWSTKGNVNPYTGKKGTKNPYGSTYSSGTTYGSKKKKKSSAYSW
jgi:hypothetical protein